jgi:hypothetical protein
LPITASRVNFNILLMILWKIGTSAGRFKDE